VYIFYDSLPLPVFLVISFVIPIAVFTYFFKYRANYPFAALIGIAMLCLAAFSAGLVRVLREYNLFQSSKWLGALPIPFALGTMLFIWIGAYQKNKNNSIMRRKILLLSFLQLFFIVVILIIVIINIG
jgi:hypothetical protein